MRPHVLVAGFAAIAAVGWVDYLTGRGIALSLFYFASVVACAWWGGRKEGVAVALAATAALVGAESAVPSDDASIAMTVWDGITHAVVFTFAAVTVSMLRRDRRRLAEMLALAESRARSDALTGLANGRAFIDRVRSEIPRLRRSASPLTLVYLDIDNFEAVNEKFGRAAGDALLKRIGDILSVGTRAGDLPARLGGDEFAVALWDVEQEDAEMICRRLVERIGELEREYPSTGIGASAGLVHLASPPNDVDRILRIAEQAMSAAKREGKARTVVTTA